MSYGSRIGLEEPNVDAHSSQSPSYNGSVMRNFLESDVAFEWPQSLGECSGNHCDISGDVIPLKWKNIISDRPNASIDMYEAGAGFSFKGLFVVKTIRDKDSQKARKMTANEVENMKDLRHPHVTALLGTFTFQARISILIFPAACCDLHQFMKQMSRGLERDRVDSHSDGTSTVDSDTANSRHLRDLNTGSGSKHNDKNPQEIHSEPWPLTEPVDKKVEMLRSYFVCLSQALSYLHSSGVRHKDIKPENILIDASGSVILTDFGISRRFPKHTPHATNNEWKFTRKYASPEIMKDKNALRDDPSDVFSLGCVFLEMATLLLGRNLNSLADYHATIINDSSKEEAYHCNLDSVHSWIENLRTSRVVKPVQEQWLLGEIKGVPAFGPNPDDHMTAALVHIRQMLDETPSNRPASKELWQRFQHVSAINCGDCDPRREKENWKPSARQQRDAQNGLNYRLSLLAIEERSSLGVEHSVSGDVDDTMLSTRPITHRSLRGSRRVSSPTSNLQNYSGHGHIRTRPELESPMSQLNMNTRADRFEAARSLSPHMNFIQKKGHALGEPRPGTSQASVHNPPADVIHGNSTDSRRPVSDIIELTSSLQLAKSQATKHVLPDRLAARQDHHLGAPSQELDTRDAHPASEPSEHTPPPQTRIIVYDVSQTIAFETVFASLSGICISPSQRLLL